MCMALTGRIVSVDGIRGRADIGGTVRAIDLDLTPECVPGDWVLVAFGAALEVLDEATAIETNQLLAGLSQLQARSSGMAGGAT